MGAIRHTFVSRRRDPRGGYEHLQMDMGWPEDCRSGPSTANRISELVHPLDKQLYAQRHLVECCFARLKQFRRVATRYEKTASNYTAVVTIAAIVLWLR